MEVFRICEEKHSSQLSSSGAANRWNLMGQYVIYCGTSRSLAKLELIVHRNSIVTKVNYKVLVISIIENKNSIHDLSSNDLPENWRSMSAFSSLQTLGSAWYLKQDSLVLRVPSAVIPQENNYIINTEHPDFKSQVQLVKVEDYFWDNRLF